MFPRMFCYHGDESIDIVVMPFDHRTIRDTTYSGITLNSSLGWDYLLTAQELWDQLEPSETVFFPGYPQWYDRNGGRPIMRTGAIVSDPQIDYRRYEGPPTHNDGNRQILFEAFSSDGNSGSPVFVSQRGIQAGHGISYSGVYHPSFLVGINAGHYEIDGGAIETVEGKIILTNWHVGLSRMFTVSAIIEVMTEMCDTYDWPPALSPN